MLANNHLIGVIAIVEHTLGDGCGSMFFVG